jgi:type I restriction enzyme S subunit
MSSLQVGPIKNFCLGIYDGPHATPKESDEGPIYLGIKNVTPQGNLDFSEIKHVSEQEFPKWTRRVLPQRNDIVFSYEATLHRYALIPEGFRGCLGRRMALVRPNPKKVNPRFLHYYFLTPFWRAVVEAHIISGATVDRIPLKKFPDFEVRLPSLDTQQYIASILSAYDDLIEKNRRRIHLLEQAARLLYKEWFIHLRFPGYEHAKIIDGVPEGWGKKTAFESMDILSGGTPSTRVPDYWGGIIPFYTPKDAADEAYVSITEKTITEDGLHNCSSKLYPKDTVFITARGTVGKINLAQRAMALNQSCYALVGHPPVTQHYLYFALKEGVEQFRSRAVGAVFDAVIRDTFKLIPFVVPDTKLIDLFLTHASPILRQIDILSESSRNLQAARDLLLPRLMNGEVTV